MIQKLVTTILFCALLSCNKTPSPGACVSKAGTYRVGQITCSGTVVSSAITRTIAIGENCEGSWANSVSNCTTTFLSAFTFTDTNLSIDRGERRCESPCTAPECTAAADVDILSTHTYSLNNSILTLTRTITQADANTGLAICTVGQEEVITAPAL